MKKFAIIVAGGSGKRMETNIPKQFLPIIEKPVLMHTIERFFQYDAELIILLVLPVEYFSYWKELCNQHSFSIPHTLVEGGNERYFSVKNALAYIPNNTLVAVHDGVRPFVSLDVIRNVFQAAEKFRAAIPVISLNDSIRQIVNNKSKAVNRNEYKLIQTPQCFHSSLLKEAYEAVYSTTYTDDASVIEANTSVEITLVDGNRENIKLTTSFDFIIAGQLLNWES